MKTHKITYMLAHHKKSILSFLCISVAFATAWSLILPAITIPAEASCGYKEHTHDASCYEEVLTCTREENHIHDEGCYDEEENLICTQEEGHIHTEACYSPVLVCGKEEHIHTLQCYADLQVDLETAADWESTLPVLKKENLREDLLQCVQSQKNYSESEKNFIIDSSGAIQNYSRYGAWNGDPYGDWGIDFVKFVFHYAGISSQLTSEQKILLLRSQTAAADDLQQWMQELNHAGVPVPLDQARAGDLVLIPCTETLEIQSEDNGSLSESVSSTQIKAGFITGFDYDQNKVICLMADWKGTVSEQSFSMMDTQILAIPLPITAEESLEVPEETNSSEDPAEEVLEEGTDASDDQTGNSPEEETNPSEDCTQPEQEEVQPDSQESEAAEEEENKPLIQTTVTASDGAVITASYEKGVLPEDVQLTARHIEENTPSYLALEDSIRKQVRDDIDENADLSISAYDISFIQNEESTKEETKVQPEGNVQITIQFPNSISASEYTRNRLFHYSDDGVLTDLTDEESTRQFDEGSEVFSKIAFTSDGFSIFANASYTYSNSSSWTYISTAQNLWDQLDSMSAGQTKYLRLNNSIWNNNGNGNTTYTVRQGKVVLDLNGFCIERQGSESTYKGVFVVKGNAALVLTNSKSISESAGGSSGSYSEADNNTYITYTGVNSSNPLDENSQVKTVKNVSIVRSKTGTAIYVENNGHLVLEKVAVMSSSDAKAVISNQPAISLAGNSSCSMTNAYVVFSYGGISADNAKIK